MSLLFHDSGGDHLVTADLPEKWTTVAAGTGSFQTQIIAAGGRHSSNSIQVQPFWDDTQTGPIKTLAPVGSTAIAGFALKIAASASGANGITVFQFLTGTTPQVSLSILPSGLMRVTRGQNGGTQLGITAVPFVPGAYSFLELKVLFHASAGTVELRMNGVTILNLTSQNTANSGTAWTGFILGLIAGSNFSGANSATIPNYDDLYICDGNGAAPWNNFLGDIRVDARVVTAAGATTQFTPSAGSNFQNVDDVAPNDDTDFNSAAAAGLTDTFVVQDVPVVGAIIYGVQHCISVKKTDAGAALIAPVTRHSGVDNVGADQAPGTSYSYITQVNQVNPGTGLQWTEADFNAAEFGYRRTG